MKLASALAACALGIALAAPASAQQAPSLYKRLGGYDALAAVTDDFVGRLSGEPQFTKFFAGHSTDSIKKIRQLIQHLTATLDKFSVPGKEKDEVLTALTPLRKDIVEKP